MPDQTEVIDTLPAADEAADEAQFEAAYAEITGKAAPQEAVTEDKEAEAEPANATDTLDASAADKAAPESNPENIEQPDPLAGVPDPVKQEFERLRAERDYLNQFRASQVGREAAHQRQIAELQRQLDGVKSGKSAPADLAENVAALASQFDDVLPGAGNALRETLAPLVDEIKTLRSSQAEQTQELIAQSQKAQEQAAVDFLLAEHPDLPQVVKSPAFDQWLNAQPQAVRAMATESQDPKEVAWALSQYKRELALARDMQASRQADRTKALNNAMGVTGKAAGTPAIDDEAEFMVIYSGLTRTAARRK